MEGLDLLGAAESLADQYITIQVKSIDRDKLAQKIGGGAGSIASSALTLVDTAPKAALDLVVPYVRNLAKEYGVDAAITVSKTVPKKARAFSEFWPGLLVGGVLGGFGFLIFKAVSR